MDRQEKRHFYGYHEIKEHGGRDFPFNIYPCTLPLDFSQVPVHWHEEVEIISIKKGQGTVTVDAIPLQMRGGEAVVIFPGQLHGISQWGEGAVEYENIIFRISMLMTAQADVCTAGFLEPLSQGLVQEPVHITRAMEQYSQVMECIRSMDVLCRNKAYGYELGIKGALFTLLGLLAGVYAPAGAEGPRKSREKMKMILEYVENHYGEKIAVQDGAALCYYSNSHFMKYFKQYMGIPFTRYLNDFRLEKAGGFLGSTAMTVTDVAQCCGFDNLSYFNRLFRQKYHLTPGAYRKGLQGGSQHQKNS